MVRSIPRHSIGIRAKFGAKAQIFGFGGAKSRGKSENELRQIAATIVKDLNEGMPVAEANEKARNLAAD